MSAPSSSNTRSTMGGHHLWLHEIASDSTAELGDLGATQLGQSLETSLDIFLNRYKRLTDYRARAWFLRCLQFSNEMAKFGTMTPSSPPTPSRYGSWWFSKRDQSSVEPPDQDSAEVKWYVEKLIKQCSENTGATDAKDIKYCEFTAAVSRHFVAARTLIAEQARQAFLDYVGGLKTKSSLAFVGVYPPPTGCEFGVWSYQVHVKTHQDFSMDEVFIKEAAAEEVRLRNL